MGERFGDGTVTILFSDVAGSTDLRTTHGDEAAHRMLRAHEDVVRRCLRTHEGREVKALGDGFMVAFASVRRALECALRIQQALAERNAESPGEEVTVRIGINTGEVTAEGDDLYGQAVNAAARIAAAAQGGEILISEIVRQLAGSGSAFTFVDRGEFGLKGFPEPWRLHAVAHDVPRLAAAFGARTPFVGRQAERVELRKAFDRVQAGSGAFVLIGGEPGVGKTRLAEEFARRCERAGFLTYTGHCYEAAGAAPYIPIVETFETALARAPSPQAFRKFLGDAAPDVARLVPRLRSLCRDIPPPMELPAEQERRYLFNSLWDVLARTARVKPTLFVLDDIHWADEPTMLLIQHFAERLADVPLLMVGLYRDSELDIGRPLSAVFGELTRRRLATRLTLRRLPADAIAEMLTGLAGQHPPPELVDLIYAETEGNPFFTEEVFKHLAEEGVLFDSSGSFRTDLSAAQLEVPEGIRLVVGARLQRLGPDGTKVLSSAAVLGRVFSFELLRQLELAREEPLLALMDEATRAGLLVPARDDADGFMFAHELIRQTVLADLSGPRRGRLHARTAELLEQCHAAALEPHAATIAHHLLQAGPAAEPKRTFRYLLMAGTWALQTAAFEEALLHLEQAAERIDAATLSERAELLYRLGEARRSRGRWDEVGAVWQEAVEACEMAGDAERAGRICAEAAYHFGWAARFEDGVAIAQRGLDLVSSDVSAVRVRLLAQQGMMAGWAPEFPFEGSAALIAQALSMSETLGDVQLRGSCLMARSLHRIPWMHLAASAAAALSAADILSSTGNRWEESVVLGFAHISLPGVGRFADARQVLSELEPLAARLGNFGSSLFCGRGMALLTFAQDGDLEELEAFARRDLEFGEHNGLAWTGHSRAWLALAGFLRGDLPGALEHAETAARSSPPGAMHGLEAALLLEIRAYAGDESAVQNTLADREGDLPRPGSPNHWGRWAMLFGAVEALHVLGRHDRAGHLYPLVVECIETTGTVCQPYFDGRLLQRTAGIAASSARRYDEAERHFRMALQQAAELPHLPEQAHTRRFLAAMLLDRDAADDRDEAARLRAEAADLYRRMGMPRHLAMVESML